MIETKRLDKYIQGKVIQLDYDFITTLPAGSCLYCLTDKHVQMILAISDFFGWSTRWYSEDGLIDKDLILDLQGGLVNALMNGCCGDEIPVQFRWTEDGDLEKSEDGGTTWEPAPEFDPRINSTQFPPVAGAPSFDKRCIAATGMSNLIKLEVGENLTDDMSRFTLGELITSWVNTLIQTSNPFQALINIAVNQIFALIISVLRAALTDTVYDQLICIFYCRMQDDISFTASGVDLVTSDIGDQIGGIATLFLQQLVNLLGVVGMTNLARSGAATEGDCSECDECLTCTQVWSIFGANHGTGLIVTQEYVQVTASDGGNGNFYVILRTPDVDTCCQVDHLEFVSGGASLHGWTDCGNAQTEGVPEFTGIGFGSCINYAQLQDANPFTVKIFFVEC